MRRGSRSWTPRFALRGSGLRDSLGWAERGARMARQTKLGDYSDADIDDVIWNLNATPRKCLGYRTPIEAFAAKLGVALEKESSRPASRPATKHRAGRSPVTLPGASSPTMAATYPPAVACFEDLTLARGWGSCRNFTALFAEAARCLWFGSAHRLALSQGCRSGWRASVGAGADPCLGGGLCAGRRLDHLRSDEPQRRRREP
jgi:hypothetical protein